MCLTNKKIYNSNRVGEMRQLETPDDIEVVDLENTKIKEEDMQA
jgi:hypothetical protein